MEALHGHCSFEDVSAADLLDAAGTLRGLPGHGVYVSPPGNGVDRPLGWAVNEIAQAVVEPSPDDRDRLATDAVVNARRALACLVDWYLTRDGFVYCRDAPHGAERKAKLLLRRGILDELTARVVARAVDLRNDVEHQYHVPALENAEDVVQLFRLTIGRQRQQCAPEYGPFFWGKMQYNIQGRDGSTIATFGGWGQTPCFVMCTIEPHPWVGVVVPQALDQATVRRAYLRDVTCEQLLGLHGVLERNCGPVSGRWPPDEWHLLLAQCGLAADE